MTRKEIKRRRLNLSMSQKTPPLMKPKLRKDHQGAKKTPPKGAQSPLVKMLKLKRGKFLKRKKMMSLDSPEDDGVNDPTKPSQEVIKHDTTAAADLAADTILYSEDNEDVQDKKKAGEKRSFPWTPHLRTKESSTQRGRHLSLSGTSPLRELKIKLCR